MRPVQDRRLEFRLLGPFEVAAAGRPVEIGSPKQRALLATLALHHNQVVPVDVLAEALWGDRLPASVPAAVQTLVYRLRRVLGDQAGAEGLLRGGGEGYLLETDPGCVDICRFDTLVAEARQAMAAGETETAAQRFRESLWLWRGPALAGLTECDFARGPAARLEEARLEAVEELAEAELAGDHPGPALALLEPHLRQHPLRERAWGLLMVGLYRLGRQADALRAYQDVRHILADELGIEPNPTLRSLEHQILRQSPDLDPPPRLPVRPVEVDATVDPKLPSASPVVTSVDSARHNLPSAVTRFVGRTAELDDLQALLATTRLLTITGVGGAGKTRLALELATRVRPRFPDGVWLAELAPVQDAASVPLAVLDALGILSGGLGGEAASPVDRLCGHLRSRRVLLFLDNCEHLTDSVAHLVDTVLARCPDVTVLTTSREVLGTAGETPWVAPPLSLPRPDACRADELAGSDAVALFCDRARTAQPGFGLTDDNAVVVGQISRRLDGIPLALELAAARVRVLGAHQVGERLDDRFRLLVGGPRTAASRHRTLRATMDWSYELLLLPERVLLRRLSVFPQSFDLAAAEAVGADEAAEPGDDVVDLLGRLVDKSLVVVDSEAEAVRYRLLETVRQYGLERLAEAGEEEASRRRHRDFFLALAEAASVEIVSTPWILRADADHENLLAAVDWSLSRDEHDAAQRLIVPLWRYWWFTGRLGAATARLDRALAGPEKRPTFARIECLVALQQALIDAPEGDVKRAAALGAEALDLALAGDDWRAAADAHFYRGQASHFRGDVPAARHHLEMALALGLEHDDVVFVPWSHLELGWAALAGGDLTEAREQFERALAEPTRVNDVLSSHVLGALAPLMAQLGEPDRAEAMGEEAVRLARGLPLRSLLAMALTRAAQAAVLSDRPARAAEVLRELLALLRDLAARRWVADALEAAALVLRANGAVEAAAEVLAATRPLRGILGERESDLPALAARIEACRTEDRLAIDPTTLERAPRADDAIREALTRTLRHLGGR